jgi:hypothetical protein
MKIQDIIKDTDWIDSDEKQYWLDLLPTMDRDQQRRLVQILHKEDSSLKDFNLEFMTSYGESVKI